MDGSDNKKHRDSQADMLVKLVEEVELFHNPDRKAYATIKLDDHSETWPIHTKTFRSWLGGKFWHAYQKAPGSQALQDALNILASKAIFEGKEHKTNLRMADYDGAIWIDLANKQWNAVKITEAGWEIVANPPIKFIRSHGLMPLPVPVSGGSVNQLCPFINLSDQNDWVLIATWLAGALRPTGPYPVLVINGEQGSAKTTLCRLLRALIDPNKSPLRAEPRDVRDLMIAASNSWVIACDNMSHLPNWLSDALCRMATGGGFATRELYSDNEEVIFDVMRPVIINGIEELATRADLLDRSIIISLPPIPEDQRKMEKTLWEEFNTKSPAILGALFDAISEAMGKFSMIELPCLPRMADYATWSVAAETALGLPTGSFLTAYNGNQENANSLAIEASVVGPAIQKFMQANSNGWEGTAQELLNGLELLADESIKKYRGWPQNPNTLGRILRRLAPNLRRISINVSFDRENDKSRRRIIKLECIDRLLSMSSEPSVLSDETSGESDSDQIPDSSDNTDNNIQSNSNGNSDLPYDPAALDLWTEEQQEIWNTRVRPFLQQGIKQSENGISSGCR